MRGPALEERVGAAPSPLLVWELFPCRVSTSRPGPAGRLWSRSNSHRLPVKGSSISRSASPPGWSAVSGAAAAMRIVPSEAATLPADWAQALPTNARAKQPLIASPLRFMSVFPSSAHPTEPPPTPSSLRPLRQVCARFAKPQLKREVQCVMLLTCEYISSAALMTFELDS